MNLDDFRVAQRSEGDHKGKWGFWSEHRQRWGSVIYMTEREAMEAFRHLSAMPAPKKLR